MEYLKRLFTSPVLQSSFYVTGYTVFFSALQLNKTKLLKGGGEHIKILLMVAFYLNMQNNKSFKNENTLMSFQTRK